MFQSLKSRFVNKLSRRELFRRGSLARLACALAGETGGCRCRNTKASGRHGHL